jgi:hypothetical protein
MKLLAALKTALFPAYRVRIQGRAGILYREGKKEMTIDSEMLVGKFDYVVYLDSISKWRPPFDHLPVSREDKERIRRNLARSLGSLSIDWDGGLDSSEANQRITAQCASRVAGWE